MAKSYVFGKDTLQFDNDDDAIKYAEETGASEFKPLDSSPALHPQPTTMATSDDGSFSDPLLANADNNGQTVLESTITSPRQLTAIPVGLAGGVLGAAQGAFTNTSNSFGEGFRSAYNQGVQNEGLAGMLANPINLAFAPVNALENGASQVLGNIPKIGPYVAKIAKPLTGTLGGTGISVGDQLLNGGQVQALPTVVGAGTGLAGGLASGVGGYLGKKAVTAADYEKGPFWTNSDMAFPSGDAMKAAANKQEQIDPQGLYDIYQRGLGYSENGTLPEEARQEILLKAKRQIAQDPNNLYKDARSVPVSEANNYFQTIKDASEKNSKELLATTQPKPVDVNEIGNMLLGIGGGGIIGHAVGGVPGAILGGSMGAIKMNPRISTAINTGINKALPVAGNVISKVPTGIANGLYSGSAMALPAFTTNYAESKNQ